MPGFWTFIDVMVQQGTVCCPVSVYDELVGRTDDELAAWAGEREGLPFFLEPDEAVQEFVGDVAAHVTSKYGSTKAVADFLDGADPWLIAYARIHGGTVITLEAGAIPGKTSKVKIPIVCDDLGVSWDSLFEMLEKLGMRLSG
ncbi:MAG: DUF4411 family protein [Chloroflexi bacterium]|nr:DUF4411 family protein [Chloroflexota bacterium]